jgi:hypothetical protein
VSNVWPHPAALEAAHEGLKARETPMNIPNDAITFSVTLRCGDVVEGCNATTSARAAIRGENKIEIVDVPEGWCVDESSGAWTNPDPYGFDVRCPKHPPKWLVARRAEQRQRGGAR